MFGLARPFDYSNRCDMAKKIYALFPEERERECDHPSGFPYRGQVPCTGPRVCRMCGTHLEDAEAEKVR